MKINEVLYKKKLACYKLKDYFDIIEKSFIMYIEARYIMIISERVKVLCVRCNVSEAELIRRLGKSPQSFNSKMKRENFLIPETEQVDDVLGVSFNREFILKNGDII